jgi:CRP/FNR family transcriptional regulator, nitrogen oxide reductase regulator
MDGSASGVMAATIAGVTGRVNVDRWRRGTILRRRSHAVDQPGRQAIDVLRAHSLFAGLPEADLSTLAAASREQRLQARERVFTEGDPARWFCLVIEGHVRIFRQSSAGKDVVLELLGPGEPFGAVAALEQRPYPASAQATEPALILKIQDDVVRRVAERHAGLVREVALMIGRRLRAAHDAVKSLAVDPVEARLAATLLRLAEREGTAEPGRIALRVPVTRQTLADMSGTTVETAIRVIARWQREGLVGQADGRFVLADVDALRTLAGGDTEPPPRA